MRGMSFRVWNTKDKVMQYTGCIPVKLDGSLVLSHLTPMLSTQVSDRQGVLIYEGDFLECDGNKYAVLWHDCGYRVYLKSKDMGSLAEYAPFVRVCGNIYEYPELADAAPEPFNGISMKAHKKALAMFCQAFSEVMEEMEC